MTEENSLEQERKEVECSSTISFTPPVYIQRYLTIADLLQNESWKHRISQVVDYGCAELKFFNYLKRVPNLTSINAVDIEKNLIMNNIRSVEPLLFEYISGFSRKLTVNLFAGSIAEPDKRLLDVDAIICIELIEHLQPEVLEKVPDTIFKYIQPKIAVFTTPNADFNVLFNLKGMRHDDHKFEWTREEFKRWCCGITKKYTNYDVYFEGIGRGPEGTEHLGCCSQMAVFSKNSDVTTDFNQIMDIGKPYELLRTIEYPFKEDDRNELQKFQDELTFRINNLIWGKNSFTFQRSDFKYQIPVKYLYFFLQKWCSSEEVLIEKLQELDYLITTDENDKNSRVLIYTLEDKDIDSNESDEENVTICKQPLEEDDWDN